MKKTRQHDIEGAILDIPLRYAKDRGFVITGEPWGNILLVEVAPGARLAPYVELWIPIQ